MQKFNASAIASALADLTQWQLAPDQRSIHREFKFGTFIQAFGFMTQVALMSEKRNHHPEWSNIYNRVRVTWTTHDADGLTENDFAMAGFCDRVASDLLSGS
jgi:4a-hydroxytetrahydrobiopterin dehydratase